MCFNGTLLRRGGALLLPGLCAAVLSARVLKTPEEAIALAFPGTQVTKEAHYLTAQQKATLAAQGVGEVPGLVFQYRVQREGQLLAFAYLDTHRVRTLPETLLVILNPQGQVLRVEVLAFAEPPDYLPRESWYRQFAGTSPEKPPRLGENLRPVAGATLTAQATATAVRRVLALHQVLSP
ncbi:MAG: hypothetical protein ACOY7U_00540 [Acidobacteriota bacterium]